MKPHSPPRLRAGVAGVAAPARLVALVALVAALLASACAAGAPTSGPAGSHDEITRQELDELNADDVMEAVTILRPQWLRYRPMRTPGSPEPVVGVVVDGRPRGTRADLAQIPIGSVERIQFMSAGDATIRFGTGYTGGAIIVTTRRSGE